MEHQDLKYYYYQQALNGNYRILAAYARKMRVDPTPAERLLWGYLRGARPQGLHFRRQHIIFRYIVDFICLSRMLIIELDGPVHDKPEQQRWDAERTSYLEERGYQVIRYHNEDVFRTPWKVATEIVAAARARPSHMVGPTGSSG